MQTFEDYLAEQMKDPEFAAAYVEVSAEEDAKLAEIRAELPPLCLTCATAGRLYCPHERQASPSREAGGSESSSPNR